MVEGRSLNKPEMVEGLIDDLLFYLLFTFYFAADTPGFPHFGALTMFIFLFYISMAPVKKYLPPYRLYIF